MGKKIYHIIWMCLLGTFLVLQYVQAEGKEVSGYCGAADAEESVQWKYEDGVLTISGNGRMKDYPAGNTAQPWESYAEFNIDKIVVEKGVTYIGAYAFIDCRAAKKVELPEGLIGIGDGAFKQCMRLTKIELPDTLETIGICAFEADPLTEVIIPSSVSMIASSAFSATFYDEELDWRYTKDLLTVEQRRTILVFSEGITQVGSVFPNAKCPGTVYFPATITFIDQENFVNQYGHYYAWAWVIYGKNRYTKAVAASAKCVYVDATKEYDMEAAICKTDLSMNQESRPRLSFVYMHDGNEVILNEGVDYEISYGQKDGQNIATITGLGCYKGTKEIVCQAHESIEDYSLILEGDSFWRTGQAIRPEVQVTNGEKTLRSVEDYYTTYYNNIQKGTATVEVTGCGDYCGTLRADFAIVTKELAELTCSLSQTKYVYDGTDHIPDVMVMDGTEQLIRGRDYDIAIEGDTVHAGTVSITINSIGNGKYSSDNPVVLTYEIVKDDTTVEPTDPDNPGDSTEEEKGNEDKPGTSEEEKGNEDKPGTSEEEKGNEDKPGTAEEEKGNEDKPGSSEEDKGNEGKQDTSEDGKENEGKPDTTKKENNGTGNAVRPISMEQVTIAAIADAVYCGREITPELTITDGESRLVQDKDYTITYTDNINAGTAHVLLKGIGTYSGERVVSFQILPHDVSGLSNILKGADGTIYKASYTGKKIKPKTSFRLKTMNGGEVVYLLPKEGVDYTCQYRNNKKIGLASIVYTFIGNYTGTVTKAFQIVPCTPKMQSVKKVSRGCLIRWKKVKEADYYEIYRGKSKKKFVKIAKVKKAKQYIDRKATGNQTYRYKVVACKKRKKIVYRSAFSNVKNKKREYTRFNVTQ